MMVYLAAHSFSKQYEIQHWCERLHSAMKLARLFVKRAGVKRIIWFDGNNHESIYTFDEVRSEILNASGAFATSLSQKEYRSFRNDFSVMFNHSGMLNRIPNVYDECSKKVSIVWIIDLEGAQPSVISYETDVQSIKREVVRVSEEKHFEDDAVCRVLYCNNPAKPENEQKRGYSVADYMKHSKLTEHIMQTDPAWVSRTQGCAAQFLPKYKLHTRGYNELIVETLLDAMRSGKYAENSINHHVYDGKLEIGASNGRMTTKVHICIQQGEVHIYPE